MNKLLSYTMHLKWYDFVFPIIVMLVFFSMPMLFEADSTVYLANSEFLGGYGANYSAYRGPVVPFLIMLMGKFFSYTVYGLKVGFFCLYIAFFSAVMAILFLLGIPKKVGRGVTWLLAGLTLGLNVVILTYSHAVLTEFFMITLTSWYLVTMLLLYRFNPKTRRTYLIKYLVIGIFSSVFLILAYAIKQMFFPLILLCWFAFGVLDMLGHFSYKKIIAHAITLCLLGTMLLSYITVHNSIVTEATMEGSSVDNYAGSFLIDGLRYFEPVGDIVYGQPTTVNINDVFTEPIRSFNYTFQPGLFNSIRYVIHCFFESPTRWLSSYEDNYKVIAGVVRCEVEGVNRRHTRVTQTIEFEYLYESGFWVDFFKGNAPQLNPYPESIGTELSQERFSNQVVQQGFAVNILFNTHYSTLSIMMHTVITYHAPIIFILSIILLFFSKRYDWINKKLCILNAFISFNITFYILFLAVTAQNIERYGIPSILFCGMFWIVNIAYLLSFLKKHISFYRTKKL